MQFIGKKGIALFVGVVVASCGVGLGSGWLMGRQFPAHHYEKYGQTRYLLDPTDGKICDPFKDPSASSNPIDQTLNAPTQPTSGEGTDPFAAYGGHEIKPASNYPPACGK